MKKLINNIFSKTVGIGIVLLSSVSAIAGDAGIGDRLSSAAGEVGIFGDLLMIIIGVAGVILLFMGGIGLKKYADNSQQNPLMKPMIFFVAGGIMTGFTAFQSMLSTSLTGSSGDEDTGRGGFKAPDSSS